MFPLQTITIRIAVLALLCVIIGVALPGFRPDGQRPAVAVMRIVTGSDDLQRPSGSARISAQSCGGLVQSGVV